MWAKAELRKKNKKIRSEMSADLCKHLSQRICKQIIELPEFINANSILLYHGIMNEVDTDLIFSAAIAAGKRVYYPKTYEHVIRFFQVKELSQLTPGVFGVCEPSEENPEFTEVRNPCIIVVPGLAYSKSGYRIGYGKGYYDRFFAAFSNEERTLMTSIGIGYHFQFEESFEPDSFDIPLSKLMDEDGIIEMTEGVI